MNNAQSIELDDKKQCWWIRLEQWLRRTWNAVRPGPRAWQGASWGTIPIAVIMAVWCGVKVFGIAGPVQLVVGLLSLMIGVALLSGIVLLLGYLLSVFPRRYGWLAISALLLFLSSLVPGQIIAALLVSLVLVAIGSMLGASIWILVQMGNRDLTRTKRVITWAGLLLGLTGLVGGGWFLLSDGYPVTPPENAAALARADIAPLDLPDPSLPGDYTVRTLTYGSGSDRHRQEYGEKATIVTTSVDGSQLVEKWSVLRTSYWGFDSESMPRNGRVWYPERDGTFPLVLVVHGNHFMEEYSDSGYAYLGELLASRGFIVASVDENFLNVSASADFFMIAGLKEENDARGWLLLEHLSLWQEWNEDPGSPFFHKVDLDQVALIGHSRGGEAAAVAAAFNRLSCYPENASLAFNYHFGIRSVIGIAPTDGQYLPGDRALPLENINYLVLHGAQDMDVSDFMGARTFERIQFTDGQPWFKAGVYVYDANHGQFNTSWGRNDLLSLGVLLSNLEPLMSVENQEQIAKVYISALLEATLHGEESYRLLFQDYRRAPGWLPDTIYLSQYQDSAMRLVSTYDEDIDPGTTTLSGGAQSGENLTLWQEQLVESKWDNLGTSAVYLGWKASSSEEVASYTITLPPSLSVDGDSMLVFSLADANTDPDLEDKDTADRGTREPIDLTLELIDQAGNKARLPLSHDSLLQLQIEDQTAKLPFLVVEPQSQAVYRTFQFRLADFAAASPDFDPVGLAKVRFVFDRTESGVVVLDNLGFQ